MSNIIDKIQLSGVTYDLVGGGGGGSNVSEVTQAEYDALVSGGTVDPDTLYIISDAPTIDMNDYVTKVANVASVAIITASTSNDTAIIPQSSSGVTTFYLKGGTSGNYCYFNFGYKYNNYNYCCYSSSFYWGSTFTMNYATVSYDSETDIYTITANEGYAYYNLLVAGGTFTIFTEPVTISGQSAKVIGDSIPFVMDTLNNQIASSDFSITNFNTDSSGLRLQYKKGSGSSSWLTKLSDDSTIYTNYNGKMYTKPVSSTTSSEVEIMTVAGTCYNVFNSAHDGVSSTNDNTWNLGANNYKFRINSSYTYTGNRSITINYGYGNSKTVQNGSGSFYLYYRYSGSSIVYSIGNSSNYSNDYSALTSSIKSSYHLDVKLESSAITYTKEDQQYSGYYYWASRVYFNNCQNIASYSTTFISGATYVTNDVQINTAVQNLYDVYDYEAGMKMKKITQSDYDNLDPKDDNTLYIVVEDA